MSFVEYTQSYIFSSDEANGAKNKSEEGASFDVQLSQPITIPKDAVNCTLECTQANIWYNTPNISERLNNNKLYVQQIVGPYDPAQWVELTVPTGLWSVSALNAQISLLLQGEGFAPDLVSISANNATQRTVITFGAPDVFIDFTQNDTFRELLGFNSQILGPSTAAGEYFPSDNIAAFNTLNSYLIHSDLVGGGIPVNDSGANIIAQVPITAKAGFQIVYQPFNPSRTGLQELIGLPRNSFRVWLTDQNNTYIDTNNENYSIVVVIRYTMPLVRNEYNSNTF